MAQDTLRADGLGDLVGVEAVGLLELVDEVDVLGLGLLGSGAIVDLLLPGVLLGLALQFGNQSARSLVALEAAGTRRCGRGAHLQVEHARGRGAGDVLAGADLVQGCAARETSAMIP